jgi:hypothetical protein
MFNLIELPPALNHVTIPAKQPIEATSMTLRTRLFHFFGNLVFKGRAKNKTVDELAADLTATHEQIMQRVGELPDSQHNRRILSHIIGIERWGQRRLRVALGEPLIEDEYNGYRPAREVAMPALREQFAQTRQETIAIARQLSKVSDSVTIPHNGYGAFSVKDWLHYLTLHASFESKKLRS